MILDGFNNFIVSFFYIFFMVEINQYFEELTLYRKELRKGFFKSSISKLIVRLRRKKDIKEIISNAISLTPLFLAFSLLPVINNFAIFDLDHSFWWFVLFMSLFPVLQLVFNEKSNSKKEINFIVSLFEKEFASISVLIMILLIITTLTGVDSFKELASFQNTKEPISLMSLATPFLFVIMIVYWFYKTNQGMFSRDKEQNDFFKTEAIKAVGITATIVLFFNLKGFVLFFTSIAINMVFHLIFKALPRIRDDQAEDFILWEITPLSLFLFLVVLTFSGFKI